MTFNDELEKSLCLDNESLRNLVLLYWVEFAWVRNVEKSYSDIKGKGIIPSLKKEHLYNGT